eukprot:scaffold4907_cov122-Isochrysis_galbana.AAC.2
MLPPVSPPAPCGCGARGRRADSRATRSMHPSSFASAASTREAAAELRPTPGSADHAPRPTPPGCPATSARPASASAATAAAAASADASSASAHRTALCARRSAPCRTSAAVLPSAAVASRA